MNRATWRIGMVLGLLLAGASAALADAPNLSDPKSAAKEFAKGVQNDDLPLIKAASVGSDSDYKLLDTLASVVKSTLNLRKEAAAKFGAEEANKLRQAGPADLTEIVDKSTVKVDGDNASLSEAGQDPANALKLKKVGNDWKIDLNQMPNKDELNQSAPVMKELQKVVEQTTDDLKAGKFKNVQEVQQTLQTRAMAAVASMRLNPTSQPGGK